jgi:hypothetical protein
MIARLADREGALDKKSLNEIVEDAFRASTAAKERSKSFQNKTLPLKNQGVMPAILQFSNLKIFLDVLNSFVKKKGELWLGQKDIIIQDVFIM